MSEIGWDLATPVDEEPGGLDIAFDDRAGVGVNVGIWGSGDGRCRFVSLVFVTRLGEEAHDLTPVQAAMLGKALIALT